MNEFMEAERDERTAAEMLVSALLMLIFMATLVIGGFVAGHWSGHEQTTSEACK